MIEDWKKIPEFEDYEASTFGNIRSLKKQSNGKILKPFLNKDGYELINLFQNKKRFTGLVHRLIMKTFIGESSLTVNHIDGIKTNNRLDNLEYCTRSQNIKHSFNTGLHSHIGEKNTNSILKNEDVLLIRKLNKEYNIKQKTLSLLFGVNNRSISNIVLRKSWRHI